MHLNMKNIDERNSRLYRDITIRSLDEISEESDLQMERIRQSYTQRVSERLKKRKEHWDQIFQGLLARVGAEEMANDDHTLRKPKVTFAKETTTILFENQQSPFIPPVVLNNCTQPDTLQPTPHLQPASDDAKIETLTPNQSSELDTIIAEESSVTIDPIEPQTKPVDVFSNEFAIENYQRLQDVLTKTKKSYTSLTENISLKNYRNDIELFIRRQINGISNNDPAHIQNKINKLSSLFNGKAVEHMDRYINTKQHEAAPLFCLDLAAQTFVNVGSVKSASRTASAMATIINSLMVSYPLFEELVIGHIQQRCPYTVPLYPTRDDVSEIEHKIACGYNYNFETKTLESDAKYIDRMSSLIMLYSSMCQQRRIQHAWSWLAAMLNVKPEPVITAIVLRAFLMESSEKLSQTYGKQYEKVLKFMVHTYLVMVKDVSDGSRQPSYFLLKTYLEKLLEQSSKLHPTSFRGSIFGDTNVDNSIFRFAN